MAFKTLLAFEWLTITCLYLDGSISVYILYSCVTSFGNSTSKLTVLVFYTIVTPDKSSNVLDLYIAYTEMTFLLHMSSADSLSSFWQGLYLNLFFVNVFAHTLLFIAR